MDVCQSRKAIGSLLFLACTIASLAAAPSPRSVTLAWSPSEGISVAGYRVYEGAGSGNYTNVIDVGDSTSATLSNLVPGTTYYFAASAYDVVGLESPLSAEISYTVRQPSARLEITVTPQNTPLLTGIGPAGYKYSLLATSDLQTWWPIATLTMDANGSCRFVDTAAPLWGVERRYYQLQQQSP